MAIEQARAFMERITTDQEFVKTLEALEDNDAKAKAIKDMGYDFTEDEIRGVLQEHNGELGDAELDAIAGGASSTTDIGVGVGVVGVAVGIIAAA